MSIGASSSSFAFPLILSFSLSRLSFLALEVIVHREDGLLTLSVMFAVVGDCDRLLASSFSLPLPPLATTTTSSPPFATPRRREVKISSFYLGTRLHAREILIEGYKWGGQIHFTVGFDNFDVVAGTTSGRELLVRSILAEVERVGNRLVEQVLAEEVGGGSKL